MEIADGDPPKGPSVLGNLAHGGRGPVILFPRGAFNQLELRETTMSATFQTLLAERERSRTVWNRTYAPLRRAITGSWRVLPESIHSEARFDADGGFDLKFFDSNIFLKGRYTIVAVEGVSYIVLDSGDGTPYALRMEEIDPWRLKLRWVDPDGPGFELTRIAPVNGAILA